MDRYEELLEFLDEEDYFSLFHFLKLEPRWANSAGKRSIQIIGACHEGDNHSALFDSDTLKVNCFSECNRGMLLHTFLRRALHFYSGQEAKAFLINWADGQEIDIKNKVRRKIDFEDKPYEEYQPEIIQPIEGILPDILAEITKDYCRDIETLSLLSWHLKDKIDPHILQLFDIMYRPGNPQFHSGEIILPHHNKEGEIVGLYERSFKPLRQKVKKLYPELPYKELAKYPRAKYVPVIRPEKYQEEKKTSWSFPNSRNLYGLHLAKESIKETKQALVFEGAKSVMLSRQYGFPNAVATHTFGANINHISMLLELGAEEIILCFDKEYEDFIGTGWNLYNKKTSVLAERVKKFCVVSRIVDRKNLLPSKASPVDLGQEAFKILFDSREDSLSFTPKFQTFQGITNKERELVRGHDNRQLELGLRGLLAI